MSEVTLDGRGRLTLPKEVRERYGDHYRIIQLHDGIKLVPVRRDGRKAALDEAGR
jgi:bifunctional DNA-binding transcriptional regulator/antitoxin component of YhaV-PrlF toxin-antitoxin module